MTRPPELAVRCDGGDGIGAGHVARCLPIASAFAALGWRPTLRGSYDGLAAWMIERHGLPVGPADGLDDADAALVDLYDVAPADLCALAARIPVATLAEAARCPEAGVWVDYHADRDGDEPSDRLLPGLRYAPVDPRFAGAGRPADIVETVLVTVGGSAGARARLPELVAATRATFPGVRLLVTGDGVAGDDVERLPFPGSLLDVVGRVDLAVAAAGMTAYELAAAGVPMVLVQVADNQRRVVDGLCGAGAAARTVRDASEAGHRRALARRGRELVDGSGATRVARVLDAAWR